MTKTIHGVHFRVPNDINGRKFIENLRLFKNKERIGRISALTRGPRPPGSSVQCERSKATGFAIYLHDSEALNEWERERDKKEVDQVLNLQERLGVRVREALDFRKIIEDKNQSIEGLRSRLGTMQAESFTDIEALEIDVRFWKYAAFGFTSLGALLSITIYFLVKYGVIS
ncbi:unnamed protein product [marine sediment metagenome]|uniref:Uncharacterized protein n=1 Tax=marine sediment metagenome TaxID=412755 RepID=X0RP30_9ZZZZ